jgi:predicted GNAT family acetyltransferase
MPGRTFRRCSAPPTRLRVSPAAGPRGCGWERHRSRAQRLYALGSLDPPSGVPGRLRSAADEDVDLILTWVQGFEADTGSSIATADTVRRRIGAGQISIWDDRAPVAMATHTVALAGVSRVGLVYTAPERRGHGYGAACTAAVTQRALDAGAERCVLYTQLQNPQSNAIYRRLGYRPVSEHLRYQFAIHPARGGARGGPPAGEGRI